MCHMSGRLKATAKKRARGETAVSDKLPFYHTGLISVKANFVMGRVRRTRTDSNSAKPSRCSGDKHRQNQTAPSRTLPIHWAEVNRGINSPKFVWFTDLRSEKAVHFIPTVPIHFVPINLTCKGSTAFLTSCSFACSAPMKSYNMWNTIKCHDSWSTLILHSFTSKRLCRDGFLLSHASSVNVFPFVFPLRWFVCLLLCLLSSYPYDSYSAPPVLQSLFISHLSSLILFLLFVPVRLILVNFFGALLLVFI